MRPDCNRGIIYPQDAKIVPDFSRPGKSKEYWVVPHKAWSECRSTLDAEFASMSAQKPAIVFVLAPLHKGKVFYDEDFCIYTYSDCPVDNKLLIKNDDVCSEEYSYEMLLPYLDAYFPDVPSTAFYAPEKSETLKGFIAWLKATYPKALFIVSNNSSTNCSEMWLEAF